MPTGRERRGGNWKHVEGARGCLGKKGTPRACNKNCGSSGPIPKPRLLAPGLRIPPWPASATSSASCASQGRGTMGACADPAPRSPASPPGRRGRVRGEPQAARPGNGLDGGWWPCAPAVLLGMQIATRRHLPSHGCSKHVALETATGGRKPVPPRFSKAADSDALALEDSRQVQNHTFPFL